MSVGVKRVSAIANLDDRNLLEVRNFTSNGFLTLRISSQADEAKGANVVHREQRYPAFWRRLAFSGSLADKWRFGRAAKLFWRTARQDTSQKCIVRHITFSWTDFCRLQCLDCLFWLSCNNGNLSHICEPVHVICWHNSHPCVPIHRADSAAARV